MSDAQKYRVKEGATCSMGFVHADYIGEVVVKVWDRPDDEGDILVETVNNGRYYIYVNQAFLEPVEFKVGDRVRAESKTNEDVAEFTVTNVTPNYVESSTHVFDRTRHNFTLLSRKPEPLKVGDEVLIDDERIPVEAIMVRSGCPMVKTPCEVRWASGNNLVTERTRPAKIVWLPES